MLDEVEDVLRSTGKKHQADDLLKLQQAAGIEIEINFGVYDPADGHKTAEIDKVYKETFEDGITPEQFNIILQNAHTSLPEGSLKAKMGDLLNKLHLPETQSAKAKKQNKPKV
ncbi:MAG: hypothetical protein KAI61_07835 [Alphaproteobacteria bacterium]|nr:hypothetical protein [Alphaproteobacteria bacterium]